MMELYSVENGIQHLKVIEHSGGSSYPDKLSKGELNALGYFKVFREPNEINQRYYDVSPTEELVDNVYTISHTQTDKGVADVQALMLADLSEAFKGYKERPRVDTGLGYFVDGSRDDILNFEDGKALGVTQIKDADGNFHTVDSADYDIIIAAQKANGLALYNAKWVKEAEIKVLTTVDECILYEATPYDYVITAEDVLANDTLVEGEILPRLKNNVKEW